MFPLIEASLERVLSFPRLNSMYSQVAGGSDDQSFFERSLARLRIGYQVSELDKARLPRRGPAVVVANHPFGGIEGIVLADLLLKVRPDVKIMANYLLERIPEVRDHLIFVDPFGRKESAMKNLKGVRESIDWLKNGKLLGIFPAGEVSHWHLKKRSITDPEWGELVAGLIRKTRAAVVPIYFQGKNSAWFHLLGLIHPLVRTAMLSHELLNKMDSRIEIKIGQPIPFKKVERFPDDREMIDYLRQRTYLLEKRLPSNQNTIEKQQVKRRRTWKPLVVPTVNNFLLEEVRNLPDSQLLLEQEDFVVFWARASQVPYVLREVGRLREITFREAGEGTGDSIDLDAFDTHYHHLILWQKKTLEVVGAYRLGPTDLILSTHGKAGLYTTSLFKFHNDFFLQVHPALELGRSFIRREYQKAFSTLMLLWKGIGQYVVRYPRYRFLFGPVSISDDYRPRLQNAADKILAGAELSAGGGPLGQGQTPFPTGSPPGLDGPGSGFHDPGRRRSIGLDRRTGSGSERDPHFIEAVLKIGRQVVRLQYRCPIQPGGGRIDSGGPGQDQPGGAGKIPGKSGRRLFLKPPPDTRFRGNAVWFLQKG